MKSVLKYIGWLLRGAGQVMFMENALAGLLFVAGIVIGSWLCGTPVVALGAVVGLIAATLGGCLLDRSSGDDEKGLDGFNGILIGCALPTFFAGTWGMWGALVVLSAFSPWVRTGMNKVLAKLGINSLTFPFIVLTWSAFCLGFRQPETGAAASVAPSFTVYALIEAWLCGISQVFLVGSSVCGLLFLAGLLVADRRAAVWCAIGSFVGLALAFLCRQDWMGVANGMYGFNPALTAIALGAVFRKSVPVVLVGIVATFFVQLALGAVVRGVIPGLTAPFCVTTWLFLVNRKR